jgi:hypothetical protein
MIMADVFFKAQAAGDWGSVIPFEITPAIGTPSIGSYC